MRPTQTTLGALVVSCQNGATRLERLDTEEQAGLGGLLATCDRVLREAYGCELVNYLALMLVDPVVHFHVIPRYSRPIERFGVKWVDTDWPKPPALGDPNTVAESVLSAIASELQQPFAAALGT